MHTLRAKGFSLIELLVTMGILVILSTAVIIFLNPVHQLDKAKDTVRKNDFQLLKNGLETYYADHNAYPVSLPYQGSLSDNGVVYVKKVPQDPRCGSGSSCSSGYQYITDGSASPQWYVLYGELADTAADPEKLGSLSCSNLPCSTGVIPTGYNLCLYQGPLDCSQVAIAQPTPTAGLFPTNTPIPPTLTFTPMPTLTPTPKPILVPVHDTEGNSALYSNGSFGFNWQYSWAHTVTAQPNRIMLAFLKLTYSFNDPFVYLGADGSSKAFTKVSEVRAGIWYYSLWSILNPAVGAGNAVLKMNSAGMGAVETSTYYNVSQTTPFGTPVLTGGNTGLADSVSVPNTTNTQLVIDAISHESSVPTQDRAQTALWNYSFSDNSRIAHFLAGSATPGSTGSTTMGWSIPSGTGTWMHIALPLNGVTP